MTGIAPILVAEDEEDDVFLLRVAFEKAAVTNPLAVAINGREAIRYLSGDPPYCDRAQHPLPALLLVDLKMPIANGFELLAWLQARPDLKHLPAVVLTSSKEPADKEKARQLGALDYIVKPVNPRALLEVAQQLHARWLARASSPQARV